MCIRDRLLQQGTKQGANTRRPGTNNKYSVFLGYFRDTGSPETGGQHIAYQECLLVAYRIGNTIQPLVGIGHTYIFRLTAINTATQSPTAIGVGTVVHISVTAKETFTAKSLHIHSHTVTGLYRLNFGTHLLYDAHHFVSYRNSGYSTRYASMLYMQVTGAYATQCHPHNSIARIFQYRYRFLKQSELSVFNISICQHNICFFELSLQTRSCQKATAAAAATFSESTPCDIGMRTT